MSGAAVFDAGGRANRAAGIVLTRCMIRGVRVVFVPEQAKARPAQNLVGRVSPAPAFPGFGLRTGSRPGRPRPAARRETGSGEAMGPADDGRCGSYGGCLGGVGWVSDLPSEQHCRSFVRAAGVCWRVRDEANRRAGIDLTPRQKPGAGVVFVGETVSTAGPTRDVARRVFSRRVFPGLGMRTVPDQAGWDQKWRPP